MASEITTRKAQRDILEAYFKAHPEQELGEAELKKVVGPNYRSRVDECRRQLGMHIQLVPQYLAWMDGKKERRQRLIGKYLYTPYVPIEPSHEETGQRKFPFHLSA